MPRTLQITIPGKNTDDLINDINNWDGLLGLRLQREGSLQPKGDVISLEVTDKALHKLMKLLDEKGLMQHPDVQVVTSQPLSIISKDASAKTATDVSEAIWEEMMSNISKQSNMTINNLIVMFVAGVLAVIGIVTNALHIVVGAMVIAPGFEPVVRIALGVTTKSFDWRNGAKDTAKAYLSLLAGALLTAVILQLTGKQLISGESSYLPSGVLISYWTSIKVPSIIVTVVASVAGALIIATHRSILTAGVMIALALVPSASVIVIGLVGGDTDIALKGLLRWILEVSIITLFSGLVFFWKKSSVYRRNMKS